MNFIQTSCQICLTYTETCIEFQNLIIREIAVEHIQYCRCKNWKRNCTFGFEIPIFFASNTSISPSGLQRVWESNLLNLKSLARTLTHNLSSASGHFCLYTFTMAVHADAMLDVSSQFLSAVMIGHINDNSQSKIVFQTLSLYVVKMRTNNFFWKGKKSFCKGFRCMWRIFFSVRIGRLS